MAKRFADFRRVRKRIKRSLNYGRKDAHGLHLPLSELVVDFFDQRCPFDYMEPETSASLSTEGYADPCTLVVALMYLDRLRAKDKTIFESTDPLELYLPALVLASKYMHDADTYDRVSNSDWAEAAGIESERLGNMEWTLVKNLDWDVSVKEAEFEEYLEKMERWVSRDFVRKNDFCTYNELLNLASTVHIMELIKRLVSVISMATLVYTFSVVSVSIAANRIMEPATTSSSARLICNETAPIILLPVPHFENNHFCEEVEEQELRPSWYDSIPQDHFDFPDVHNYPLNGFSNFTFFSLVETFS